MRINLKVPFAQKDAAKELGARWDAARKIWYVVDPVAREVFADWMPTLEVASGKTDAVMPSVKSSQGVLTGPKNFTPVCQCAVLPWEHCAHSTV